MSEDWAVGASRHFAMARRTRPRNELGVRLEWLGESFDSLAMTNPDPPAWVDMIAPLPGDALVRVRVFRPASGDQRAVEERFEVWSPAGEAGSSRYMRRAGLGAVRDTIDRVLLDFAVSRILGDVWRREVRRPGRAGRSDIEYAEFAEQYVAACARDPRRPIALLVDEAAKRGEYATAGQLRARLNRARDRGLLTPAPEGKAGGTLTKRARTLLAQVGRPSRRRSTR